jgi:6-phosphogluconolactonase (cycloisomerase 2 family)
MNNKIIKFCNYGTTVIIGGFYDGKIEIINIEDKTEKSRKEIYPFNEEEPILSLAINNDETFMILGNSIGNIAIYQIDLENDKCDLYKKIFNLNSPISDININNDLNLLAISSIDGFTGLYTWPLCKLVRSIKTPIDKENNGKLNYVFLSESSLPSTIMVTEDEKKYEIFSYSINGSFLNRINEEKSMSYPIKIRDINSYEYLAYYSNSKIKIINLPSLALHFSIESNSIVTHLCINNDLTVLYTFNEDDTQIQALKI